MGWRSLISREALSGSLEQFPPRPLGWQMGTGGRESLSKIKAPKLSLDKNQLSGLTKAGEKQLNMFWTLAHRPAARRFGLHALVGVVVAAVVIGGGSVGAQQSSLVSRPAGMGAVLDNASAASVAATVAVKTALPVAAEANQTATTLNAQVALPTAGDDYLAKRQVVQTKGADHHTIITYSVADGDTLSGIASKFDITTATIEAANNLNDNSAIKPGQQLSILPISGLAYKVQAGDTAASLATKYQSNAAQIVSFNNAEIAGLVPGQAIIIPDGVLPNARPAATNSNVAVSSSKTSTKFLPRLSFGSNGYAFGYCTYYVAGRRYVPSNWGNAVNWYYAARASGYAVGSTPAVGAIAWTAGGYYGHVAYVESVSGGSVTVSEMNYSGGWDRVDYRTTSAGDFRYIY